LSFLTESSEPKIKRAEWLNVPKKSNWPKNILTKFQALGTAFSANVDFGHTKDLKLFQFISE
jgi:hypothetical protein